MAKRRTAAGRARNPFPIVERAPVLRSLGFVPVGKTPSHARGYLTTRAITIEGVSYAKGDFVPRRRAEQYLVPGVGKYEQRAKERFERSGGRTGNPRYAWALDTYMQNHPGATRGEARAELARRRTMAKLRRRPQADFYSHLWRPGYNTPPSRADVADYVDALLDLGLIDESDVDYYVEMFG